MVDVLTIFVLAAMIVWLVGAVWISILAILAITRTAAKRPWIRNRFALVGLGWACALVAFLLACYLGFFLGGCSGGLKELAICTAMPNWLGQALFAGMLLGYLVAINAGPVFLVVLLVCEIATVYKLARRG